MRRPAGGALISATDPLSFELSQRDGQFGRPGSLIAGPTA